MTRGALLTVLAGSLSSAALVVLACGEDLPPDSTPDAGTPDGTAGTDLDASASPGVRCSLDKPFGPRTPIPFTEMPQQTGDAGAFDRQPRLSGDELTIVFTSQRESSNVEWKIYVAERASRTEPFGKPRRQDAIHQGPDTLDVDPMLSTDGKTLYFTSLRKESEALDVYLARRSGFGADFGALVERLGLINSSSNDYHPYKTSGGLWFASDRDAGGAKDIWFARQLENGFGVPERVNGLTTIATEGFPTPTDDGLAVYFARREGQPQIHLALRDAESDPFAPAVLVPELADSGHFSVPSWLSPDRCRLYYVHSADGEGELVFVEREPD